MANSYVKGSVKAGTQQQFFARNVNATSWQGANWNMVHVGNTNAPQSHCGKNGSGPTTTVTRTPRVQEKPWIIQNDIGFSLMVPEMERNTQGFSFHPPNVKEIPFDQIYVASDTDSAQELNVILE